MNTLRRYWKEGCIVVLSILCLKLWFQPQYIQRITVRRPVAVNFNIMPREIHETLTLHPGEYPEGYQPLRSLNILEQAGLETNPSFVLRKGDRELQLNIEAFAGIVGLYGKNDEVLLILKGYFFLNEEASAKYLRIQEAQQKRINAYEFPTEGGSWFLFLAMDSERDYPQEEISAILEGLQRYQRRLNATSHFSQIGTEFQ